MFSASLKYSAPVDCMSMVCGAIVMIRFGAGLARSERSAWPM